MWIRSPAGAKRRWRASGCAAALITSTKPSAYSGRVHGEQARGGATRGGRGAGADGGTEGGGARTGGGRKGSGAERRALAPATRLPGGGGAGGGRAVRVHAGRSTRA